MEVSENFKQTNQKSVIFGQIGIQNINKIRKTDIWKITTTLSKPRQHAGSKRVIITGAPVVTAAHSPSATAAIKHGLLKKAR
jgi:hypothetical protein